MLAAFVTVFSIPPSPDMFAPTFQRPSTRFGNDLLRETSSSSGDSMFLISLRALDFRRVCHWQWTNLWTIIGDESSDSILLNLSWFRLRTSISGTHFEDSESDPQAQYNSTSEGGKRNKIIDDVRSLTSTTFFSFGLIHPFVDNVPSGSACCYQRYQGTDSTRWTYLIDCSVVRYSLMQIPFITETLLANLIILAIRLDGYDDDYSHWCLCYSHTINSPCLCVFHFSCLHECQCALTTNIIIIFKNLSSERFLLIILRYWLNDGMFC